RGRQVGRKTKRRQVTALPKKHSAFNSKRRVKTGRLEHKLFNILHGGEARAGGQFVSECFDELRRPFGQHLDTAVIQVFYVTDNLMARGRPLGKETITNALHLPDDKKPTCY
ncbi:MAG TPA: hypothetical protein VK475_00465, partial [Pyrinomonadaceae bacterium]|nr:hypothetical protein [Pyrinomonadaceae bacterium]